MNFYDSIIEGAQELPASERGQLYAAALEYLFFQREPDFAMKPAPKAMFVMMRPIFDNQVSAQERGRKGGRPRKTESQTKPEVSENGAETESQTKAEVSEKGRFSKSEQEQEQYRKEELPSGSSKKAPPRFSPPSAEEVSAYAKAAGFAGFDAQRFCDYYAAQGWRLSNGNPMREWHAAVRNWARKDAPKQAQHDFSEYD